jgi:methionyl-tRNA synthetase
MWSVANEYINDRAPWAQIKTDPDAAALTLRTAANLIFLFGVISAPIIPTTAATLRGLWHQPQSHLDDIGWPGHEDVKSLAWLRPGTGFTVPPVLFTKITDDQVSSWREQFGSNDQP